MRLPAFLPPSVLASLLAHGAAVAFALGTVEAPTPEEPRLLAVAPGEFALPVEPEPTPEPWAPPSDLPSLDLEPVLVEVAPDVPDLPVAAEVEPRAPSLRLGIEVPSAGLRARRPGPIAVPAAPAAAPVDAAPAPVPAAPVTSRPAPRASNRPPLYPLEARRLGWHGVAVFQVIVRSDGSVSDVALEQSTGYSVLDRAAEEAVRSWTFSPARKDGVPAEATVRLPVVFRLSS